ncbi:SPOR domain-containing protein [Chitinimonas arctica]|uniref:SPOR domain-containing protein n=1 Tax=Chitinimonas arctica TaxID=2594795 RepID=A0A516SB12_9NEIS|nr:SPOR domain-containing protein [Chitinimonas arctica]QDQ25335.1 SPOR domain-containing protein [Chitinimonas arctica]
MADAPISEELTTLKKRARRRLVGAIALVLLALAVLWTVMDDKPPQSLATQGVAIVSTSPELASTVAPLPAPVQAMPPAQAPVNTVPPVKPLPATAPVATPLPDPAPVVKPTPKPVERVAEKPVEKPVEKPAAAKPDIKKDPARILAGVDDDAPSRKPATEDKASEKFFLQLGAFADKDKALGLQAKAKEAGVGVQTESIKTDKGALTRLRAGPYASHEAAEKARAKLSGAGVSSNIVGK